MHWAPKVIISFFLLLVMINATLVSIATHGMPDFVSSWFFPHQDRETTTVHTVFPGVVPHDRNKLYTPRQEQLEQQRNLGWQVDIVGLDGLGRGKAANIKMVIHDAQGQPLVADRVLMGFWRMANSKDDRLHQLESDQPGEYHTEILLQDSGRWIVEIGIARGNDVYETRRAIEVD